MLVSITSKSERSRRGWPCLLRLRSKYHLHEMAIMCLCALMHACTCALHLPPTTLQPLGDRRAPLRLRGGAPSDSWHTPLTGSTSILSFIHDLDLWHEIARLLPTFESELLLLNTHRHFRPLVRGLLDLEPRVAAPKSVGHCKGPSIAEARPFQVYRQGYRWAAKRFIPEYGCSEP